MLLGLENTPGKPIYCVGPLPDEPSILWASPNYAFGPWEQHNQGQWFRAVYVAELEDGECVVYMGHLDDPDGPTPLELETQQAIITELNRVTEQLRLEAVGP